MQTTLMRFSKIRRPLEHEQTSEIVLRLPERRRRPAPRRRLRPKRSRSQDDLSRLAPLAATVIFAIIALIAFVSGARTHGRGRGVYSTATVRHPSFDSMQTWYDQGPQVSTAPAAPAAGSSRAAPAPRATGPSSTDEQAAREEFEILWRDATGRNETDLPPPGRCLMLLEEAPLAGAGKRGLASRLYTHSHKYKLTTFNRDYYSVIRALQQKVSSAR